MAKLFPFWWLNPVVTCDTVKACLEGDYTVWTEIASSPLTFTTVKKIGEIFTDEDNNFAAITDDVTIKSALFTIEPAALVSEIPNNALAVLSVPAIRGSIRSKYIAYFSTSAATIVYVYKAGVLTQTITLAFSLTSGGLWVSPSGKYLFFMDYANKQLHIYKGA